MYEVLRKLLEERKITAYKMCKDIGISPVVITDLKNGKSKPKADKLLKIAEYLDVDVSVFIKNT